MQLIVVDTDGPVKLRAAAAFCLMLAGDIAVPSLSDDPVAAVEPAIARATREIERRYDAACEVPAGTVAREPIMPPMGNVVPFPPAPPAPSIASTATAAASLAATAIAPTIAGVPSAPQPPNFSQQPNIAPTAAPQLSASMAGAQDEYDSAGLPWDGRIHQKGRSKKKDGTWKLQKGLDPVFAQAVVTELAAKRRAVPPTGAAPAAGVPVAPAAVPPAPAAMPPLPPLGAGPLMPDAPRAVGMVPELGAPYGTTVQPQFNHASVPPLPNAPQVPLPPAGPVTMYGHNGQPIAHGGGSVPVPPQPNGAPASMVPPPPVAAQVPPAPQPGPVGGGNPAVPPAVTPYRLLMDKLTAAVGAKQLDPRRIAPVCQKHGAPNFAELGKPEYAHLVAGAERDFDSLIAGLPVEGIA